MDYKETYRVISSEFADKWHLTPIIWENTILTKEVEDADTFVRFTIQNTFSENVTLGHNPRQNKEGYIYLQIFTKINIGYGLALDYVEEFLRIFENERFQDIFTYSGELFETIKDADDSNLYMTGIRVPFIST